MDSAVNIRNLSHDYGDLPALKDLSVEIVREEFFIVIGPNGSGKTTLLKLISGIEKSSPGKIEILGRPLQGYSRKALARRVALVPQLVLEEFPFSVFEVVLMGRSPHTGLLGIEAEADLEIARTAMAFTEVTHLAGRNLDRLSGGERQRVFIARAICQQPDIILLDEPTAALDLAHQVRIMDLMERLRKEHGVTVIMVSHDLNLAAMYGSRLLLLQEGKIASLGSPEAVLTYPILERTYGCTLLVDESPLGGVPRVTVVPDKFSDPGKK